jgi:site-specific recombinase XerD
MSVKIYKLLDICEKKIKISKKAYENYVEFIFRDRDDKNKKSRKLKTLRKYFKSYINYDSIFIYEPYFDFEKIENENNLDKYLLSQIGMNLFMNVKINILNKIMNLKFLLINFFDNSSLN